MTEEEITELQETNKQLVERVNQLESINTDLVDQKKELKQKLSDGATDEDLKNELENYKAQLDQVDAEKSQLQEGYTKELNSLKMAQQLKEIGVDVHNSDALNAVVELTLQEATYKDGGFVFLNEDGTTKFNEANKDYSVQDKINELRGGDKSYLFKQPTGGGATGDNPTASTKPQTDDQRAAELALRAAHRRINNGRK